jgi:chromosome segregation ATPase
LFEAQRLLSECKQIRADEQSYKRECRIQMQEVEAEIERLRAQSSSSNDQVPSGVDQQELEEMRAKLAEINKEIFHLSRQIDSKPTQIELNQYQRRFVELYNQGKWKNWFS